MKTGLAMCCLATILGQFHPLVSAAPRIDLAAPATNDIVERFLRSGEPPLLTYRARRRLEASTRGGRMTGALDARTELSADGTFRFEIVKEEGSKLIRTRVLIAALEAEGRHRHEADSVALTPANYDFAVGPGPVLGQFTLALSPRRKSPMLLNGSAIIMADNADLVRVQGRLSASPSFWTRQVDIVRRYARIEGVRVPIGMWSEAKVRLAGPSSFSMTYEYEMLNGTLVGGTSR